MKNSEARSNLYCGLILANAAAVAASPRSRPTDQARLCGLDPSGLRSLSQEIGK